jgi:hypothetical protein
MIVNSNSLGTLQTKWQGVVQMRERMDQLVFATFAFDPLTSPVFGNIFYNLPLLLAFDSVEAGSASSQRGWTIHGFRAATIRSHGGNQNFTSVD